jgi:polygalacturonase
VLGGGEIDGQGAAWYAACTANRLEQGRLVESNTCVGVRMDDLTLRDSPFWTVRPVYSRSVHISRLRIFAPTNGLGTELTRSVDVVIQDCFIANGDDGIAIKSGKARHPPRFKPNSHYSLAVRIFPRFRAPMPSCALGRTGITTPVGSRGGVAIGSEMSGGAKNVTVVDSVFNGERGQVLPTQGRSHTGRGFPQRSLRICWLRQHLHDVRWASRLAGCYRSLPTCSPRTSRATEVVRSTVSTLLAAFASIPVLLTPI